MKIVLLSDTHGELMLAKECLAQESPYDACYHMGDVGFEPEYLHHVQYVCGNHDQHRFVKERIFEVEGWKIWMLHGHLYEYEVIEQMNQQPQLWKSWDHCMEIIYQTIAQQAKQKGCDLVLFGHTHTAYFEKRDGIYLCNPGSLCFSHDGRPPSYAVLTITAKQLTCVHHFLDEASIS